MSRDKVEIPLCCLDTFVAQVILDGVNVYSVNEPLGGSEMPEIMEATNPV